MNPPNRIVILVILGRNGKTGKRASLWKETGVVDGLSKSCILFEKDFCTYEITAGLLGFSHPIWPSGGA
jgi:hypothetical protein